jgi:hypothetical protein
MCRRNVEIIKLKSMCTSRSHAGETEAQLHLFLTPVLDRSDRSAHAKTIYPLRKNIVDKS